jgi:hypothetical protein
LPVPRPRQSLLRAPRARPDAGTPGAAFSSAGCHVAVHGGQASGHTKWADPPPNGDIDATMTGQTANADMPGAIYGGQTRCDWQAVGSFVAGLEGSLAAAALTGTNQDQFSFNWTLQTQTGWEPRPIGSAPSPAARCSTGAAVSPGQMPSSRPRMATSFSARLRFHRRHRGRVGIRSELVGLCRGRRLPVPGAECDLQNGNIPLASNGGAEFELSQPRRTFSVRSVDRRRHRSAVPDPSHAVDMAGRWGARRFASARLGAERSRRCRSGRLTSTSA